MDAIKPIWQGPAGRRVPVCNPWCSLYKSVGCALEVGPRQWICRPAIWRLEAAAQRCRECAHCPLPPREEP